MLLLDFDLSAKSISGIFMFRIFKKDKEVYSDKELLDLYKSKGDTEVLGQLYARYMELVYGLCLKYFKDTQKAEDAVIEIFEQLIIKVPKHEIKQFKSWLYVLAKNHCLMQLRKKSKEITQNLEPDLMHSVDSRHHTFEIDAEEGEEEKLKKCIEQLPEKQKTCIQLFYLEDKSYKEIAASSGEDVGKIRSYIQNGRRNLRNCMEERKVMSKKEK